MIKKLVRKILPYSIWNFLQKIKSDREFQKLIHDWIEFNNKEVVTNVVQKKIDRVIIVPCDPWTIIGSLGDEAMITAAIERARDSNPNAEIHLVTVSEEQNAVCARLGCHSVPIWNRNDYMHAISSFVKDAHIDTVWVVGADVLDGYYNKLVAAKLLVFADVSAKSGASVRFLGFSFNKHPADDLRIFFDRLDPSIVVNVRDPYSLERFSGFSRKKARLVTDSAFSLSAELDGASYSDLASWVFAERELGRTVLGLNFHPLLMDRDSKVQLNDLIDSVRLSVQAVSKVREISWVLIPHDYRNVVGDGVCLNPLFTSLNQTGISCYLIAGQHSAAQLKGFASLMDAVVTGRMHLAIGSLGSGVPVLALTYQDKFEGLFKHFDLTEDVALDSKCFLDHKKLTERLLHFVDIHKNLASSIKKKLGFIKDMSLKNFFE